MANVIPLLEIIIGMNGAIEYSIDISQAGSHFFTSHRQVVDRLCQSPIPNARSQALD